MTNTLSARTGSGAAAGLVLAYVAALLAVTNLIFSAGATAASTPLPGTVVRTGTYGINLAAAAASPSATEAAPVIATPPVPLGGGALRSPATGGAQEPAAGSADQVANSRREVVRPGRSSAGGGTLFRPRNSSGAGARTI